MKTRSLLNPSFAMVRGIRKSDKGVTRDSVLGEGVVSPGRIVCLAVEEDGSRTGCADQKTGGECQCRIKFFFSFYSHFTHQVSQGHHTERAERHDRARRQTLTECRSAPLGQRPCSRCAPNGSAGHWPRRCDVMPGVVTS